jgi:tetratricopeptide (TPR) repeat protein
MNAEALALGPGNPENVRAAAYGAIVLGHLEQGLSLSRRAVDLDTLNADSWETLAETEYAMGQLDQAEEHAKKALALNPDVWPGASLLSRIYLTKGKPQESLVAIEQVRSERLRLLELANVPCAWSEGRFGRRFD